MDTSLLTSKDLAKCFGVSVETVRAWVRDGRIPYIRASRKIVRFRMDEVEAALHQNATLAPVGGTRNPNGRSDPSRVAVLAEEGHDAR